MYSAQKLIKGKLNNRYLSKYKQVCLKLDLLCCYQISAPTRAIIQKKYEVNLKSTSWLVNIHFGHQNYKGPVNTTQYQAQVTQVLVIILT